MFGSFTEPFNYSVNILSECLRILIDCRKRNIHPRSSCTTHIYRRTFTE